MIDGGGLRKNDGKDDYSQLPLHLLGGTARVFTLGEKKYARYNWLKGMKWTIPYACLIRHMVAWYRGEDNDSESGESHLDHAIANLLMLKHYQTHYKDGDDRPKEYFNQSDIDERMKKIHQDLHTAPEYPMSSGDDWIEWEGGSCPVEPYAVVKVKLRSGTELCNKSYTYDWRKRPDENAIVAYKLVGASHGKTI